MHPFPPEQNSSSFLLFFVPSGLIFIASVVLMFTNPSKQEYEEFATEQLVLYAKENLCSTSSGDLEQIIKSQVCNLMVDTSRVQFPKLITKTTQTRNYILFSVYETDLFLYEFQTIGIFNNFYIIDVHQVY